MTAIQGLIAKTAINEAVRMRSDYEARLAAANRIIRDQARTLTAAYRALDRAGAIIEYDARVAAQLVKDAMEMLRDGVKESAMRQVK